MFDLSDRQTANVAAVRVINLCCLGCRRFWTGDPVYPDACSPDAVRGPDQYASLSAETSTGVLIDPPSGRSGYFADCGT
jgi:hypothetical protein